MGFVLQRKLFGFNFWEWENRKNNCWKLFFFIYNFDCHNVRIIMSHIICGVQFKQSAEWSQQLIFFHTQYHSPWLQYHSVLKFTKSKISCFFCGIEISQFICTDATISRIYFNCNRVSILKFLYKKNIILLTLCVMENSPYFQFLKTKIKSEIQNLCYTLWILICIIFKTFISSWWIVLQYFSCFRPFSQ